MSTIILIIVMKRSGKLASVSETCTKTNDFYGHYIPHLEMRNTYVVDTMNLPYEIAFNNQESE